MRSARMVVWLPLLCMVVLMIGLAWGLSRNPRAVPSTFIGQPLPEVAVLDLTDHRMRAQDWPHGVWLLHVMASWCEVCQHEHAFWMHHQNVPMVALDYKESPQTIQAWLKQYGNPYQRILVDPLGDVAIEWGVYGTPETFLIDRHHIVRARWVGEMTTKRWQAEVLPLLQRWQQEA